MSLRVYLAGRVGLAVDEQLAFDERDMRGRQARIAFAYLAARRERSVEKEELAEVLWPEETPPAWEAALMALLSRLRGLISQRVAAGAGIAIAGGAGQYQLRLPPDAWVDLDAAAAAVDEAEGALRAGRLRDAFGPAVVSASICRRPFLSGHTGPWVETQRGRLERQLLRSLDCVSRVWLGTGEPVLAVESASETVALDPFRESSHVLLMQAHEAMGNRADALQAYGRLRQLLSEELGAEPAPETQRHYLRLLR